MIEAFRDLADALLDDNTFLFEPGVISVRPKKEIGGTSRSRNRPARREPTTGSTQG